MDTLFAFVATAGALLVAAIGGAGWWLQRRRVAELESRLRFAEDSRLEISEDAELLRQRLADAGRALAAQPVAPPAPSVDDRRASLERLLDGAAQPVQGSWEDTQPMNLAPGSVSFAPTQPAELETVGEARP